MKHLLYQISVILLLTYLPNSKAAQFQTISSMQAAIGHYITNEFKTSHRYDYSLSRLDPRLKLPLCSDSLQISTQTGSLKAGRNSIAIHCTSGTKWTIYTSAQIKSYRKVAVLSRPMLRGEIVTENQLAYKRRDISTLHRGYILNADQIINKQATRNLAAGTVINSHQFTEPRLIKKGEIVNIQAKSPYFHISMSGISMMNGRKGQHIRVKNINSKRIIQATVENPGQVSVY